MKFQIIVTRDLNGTPVEVQRIPHRDPIVIDPPTADFTARHWSA